MREFWGARLPLALIGVLVLASAAAAELKHSTEYRENRIQGATPRAVWQYMTANPIIDPDDGPAYANITHDHKLRFKSATSGGACRVTGLDFEWRFVITLPKAVNYGAMSGATQKMWQQFISYLKSHEEKHRDIFIECGKKFVPAAEKITGLAGCFGMDRKVRKYVEAQYDVCMKKQREFDRGETQTVKGLALMRAATEAKIKAPGF